MRPSIVILCAVILQTAPSLYAWDATGEMLVDYIATRQLKPPAAAKLDGLARQIDTQYNNGQPYDSVTAGCLIDDLRGEPNYPYRKLHFVNVPYTLTASPFAVPPPPHVLSAYQDAVDVLKKPDLSGTDHAFAMAEIMHFVADLNQPMHCVDWNDKGGNGYTLSAIPFSDLYPRQTSNLHTYWEKAFRFDVKEGRIAELYKGFGRPEDRSKPSSQRVMKDEAEKIMKEFPPESLRELSAHAIPISWAEESYTIACLFAYPLQRHPTDTEVVSLDPAYVHHAHEISCQRIALAGYRLGKVLNELFGSASSTQSPGPQ